MTKSKKSPPSSTQPSPLPAGGTTTDGPTFEVLKNYQGLAVTFPGREPVRLTMAGWNAVAKASRYTDEAGAERWSVSYSNVAQTVGALRKIGLVGDVKFKVKPYSSYSYTSYSYTSYDEQSDPYSLTPDGVLVHDNAPAPPPRDEWPKKVAKPPSKDNIKVSTTQVEILTAISTGTASGNAWYYHTPCKTRGYGVDDPAKAMTEGWTIVGRHPLTQRFIVPLMNMGLVELGINPEEMVFVIKPTVHGALFAKDPASG